MKNYKNKILLVQLVLYIIIFSINVYTQNCFECTGNTADGEKATALGLGNIASGDYSFAAGYQNTAEGYSSISLGRLSYAFGTYSLAFGSNCYANNLSFAFGQNARAVAAQSIAIGRFVETTYSNAIALGASSSGREMVNNIEYSLMVGFNSTQPTFFVGKTPEGQEFGKVGIGTTNPMTTLDVNGGLLTKGFAMPTINVHNGYVLTCDALGNADWAPGSQSLWTMGLGNDIYRLSGNVGIGTSEPQSKLHINNGCVSIGYNKLTNSEENGLIVNGRVGIGTDKPYEKLQIGELFTFHSGGTKYIGYNVYWDGVDNGDMDGTGDKRIVDDEVSCIRFGSNGDINFWTAPSGDPASPIEYNKPMIITNEGNVGIGTLETNGYRLAVNGKILAEELKIIGDVLSSDYVFYDDYELRSLSEVESYIDKHNHLPDVPSAEEFKENGYNVGEMDNLLLRKIEELTLYLIEQQKIIDKQQKDIGLLKK
jgi:hypothetical protein